LASAEWSAHETATSIEGMDAAVCVFDAEGMQYLARRYCGITPDIQAIASRITAITRTSENSQRRAETAI
jgi:hypothetical protein